MGTSFVMSVFPSSSERNKSNNKASVGLWKMACTHLREIMREGGSGLISLMLLLEEEERYVDGMEKSERE